jgi:ABC-type glycerol-3-phosphate transport system permease component
MKNTPVSLALSSAKYLFLSILFVVTLIPIAYILLGSFKDNQEILTQGASLLPKTFVFDNYVQAWQLANFSKYFFNSLYMAFFTVVGTIITSTMAGYVFARGKFPGKNIIFAILTSTMFISAGALYLYPQLEVAKFLGINTGLFGVIIIRIFGINITQLFLARNYIQTIPIEVDEAAKIDGCSFLRIYISIILPTLKPLIATIGLLSFMNSWNDYLLPLIFTLPNPDAATLVVGVTGLKSQGDMASSWNLMLAGTAISTVPMIVVYLFMNRFFISGLTSGAVKG